jgi:hypothetical protein
MGHVAASRAAFDEAMPNDLEIVGNQKAEHKSRKM